MIYICLNECRDGHVGQIWYMPIITKSL
ncbi:protein of unknown function [Rhodovastum atsumiense]|nr:protein of unknown function [Rhodovastum atsumiense]